jgi:hypothetical protein
MPTIPTVAPQPLPEPPTIIIPVPPVSPSEPPKASEPLKTNWSTSPLLGNIETPTARSVELSNPAHQESILSKADEDDVISFDFDPDDEEYLDEFDNDFDDEFDDFDSDYEDGNQGKDRSRAKATGLGGILNWFKKGRS